jgi:hypothetical protein
VSPRDRTALAPPPAPDALIRFPVWHVHAGTTFHRVTHGEHGPWWFSSDGSGRFDLVSPRGTCYLADDPVLAMLEVFGELVPRAVSKDWLASRRLWTLALPAQCDAADTTVRAARGFGLTAELATVTPYERPQGWAASFAAAGFDGIRYRARHDPGGGRALALFGAAGERTRWRRGRSSPLAGDLLDRLQTEAGVEVAQIPDSADLGQLLD